VLEGPPALTQPARERAEKKEAERRAAAL